jgi:hypothetical protein
MTRHQRCSLTTSLLWRCLRFACAGIALSPDPLQALEWEPLTLPSADRTTQAPAFSTTQSLPPSTGLAWTLVDPADAPTIGTESLQWRRIDAADIANTPVLASAEPQAPIERTPSELEAFINNLGPFPHDYPSLLRLGPAVPTANQLAEQDSQFSFFQLAPAAGGGNARGTGNQNYVGRIDLGYNDSLQLSAFYSEADDPLFANITGKTPTPANFWQSYGGAVQLQLLNQDGWAIGVGGSLEGWNVGSGGCDSFSCRDNISASPNIFNDSNQRVFTKNLVGSLAFPISWQANRTTQFTFTPGVSFLPSTQGAGQGGAGTFYGTNITLAAGAAWRLAPQLTLFGSGLLPLGPGTNSFNSQLVFERVPIFTGGLNYALNPRIGLEASLTNGFGGTPATAVLALPSENQLMYSAKLVWTPQARDTPELPFTPRSRSLTLGGLSVNTALIPPAGAVNTWVNADSEGNLFGQLAWSPSNDFQFIVLDLGAFNRVEPMSPLSNAYASDGGFNQRFGGKAVFLQQLRGAPITASGSITLGRNYDASSFRGYLYAEAMATWMANESVALNLNPKLAWSDIETPLGLGLSANLQLGSSFQLIPEVNLVASDWDQTNGTFGVRWLANRNTAVDLYVSNAAGIYDIGQLLRVDQARVGGKLTLQF